MPTMLTISEVSAQLNTCDRTVMREIKDGRITATKVRGHWRFTQESIDDYLESRTIKAKRKKQIA